jgi:hypothetical protein
MNLGVANGAADGAPTDDKSEKTQSKFFDFGKYGLAICCVIGPLVLGYAAPNFVADRLMPLKSESTPLQYLFPDKEATPATTLGRAERQAKAFDEAANEKTKIESARAETLKPEVASDPAKLKAARDTLVQLETTKMTGEASRISQQSKLVAETLAGRYGYAAASGFLYLIALATLLFAGCIVFEGGGWKLLLAGLIGFSIAAWKLAVLPTAYANGGNLLLKHLLDKADESGVLDSLRMAQTDQNFQISAAIDWLVMVNTKVGLIAVGLALLAFAVLAVRVDVPQAGVDKVQAELEAAFRKRLTNLKVLIFLSSAILVVSTFASKVLLDWPLKLVSDGQMKALQPLAAALTTHLGVTGTIALFATVVPAAVSYSRDLSEFSGTKPPPAGLEFAPAPTIATLVAIIAPALTSPIFNGVQSVLATFGKG